jgi:raffinose-raffinose alpha-galactotransferase
MEKELISVIVPVYNIEKYLPQCLECIERQTYRNLEIILVDDGSTDGSGKICDEYVVRDSRARVIHQANKGLWAARNAGQDEAHGEYLWFPDGDDYFHYDFLRLMHAAITDGEGYDLAMCGMRITPRLDESCDHIIHAQWSVKTSVSVFPSIFPPAPGPNVWNKLYRTSSIQNLRARPFPIAQDQDFNIQVFTQIKTIVCTEEVLYYWVRRDGQITQRARYFEIWPDILYRNYIDHPSEKDSFSYILLNQLYRRMALLKEKCIKTDRKEYFFEKCKLYYNNTISNYLKEKRISNTDKAKYLIGYHLPWIVHLLFIFLDKHPKIARRFKK